MAKLRIAFSGIGAVGGYYGGMVAARYQGTCLLYTSPSPRDTR